MARTKQTYRRPNPEQILAKKKAIAKRNREALALAAQEASSSTTASKAKKKKVSAPTNKKELMERKRTIVKKIKEVEADEKKAAELDALFKTYKKATSELKAASTAFDKAHALLTKAERVQLAALKKYHGKKHGKPKGNHFCTKCSMWSAKPLPGSDTIFYCAPCQEEVA